MILRITVRKYDRNRVRSEIIPRLEAIRPGFSASAARSVGLIGEALEVLKSVARSDLEACRSETMPHGLSVYRLLELIPARQAWCLRAWIAAEGLRPLSKARLDDLLRQVRETHSDATFSFHVQRKGNPPLGFRHHCAGCRNPAPGGRARRCA